jgi:pilus assembly protein CpaF
LPARLEALALAAGLGRDALHSQLLAAVQLVVHVARDRHGERRVAAVSVLARTGDGLAEVVPALVMDEHRRLHEASGAGRLSAVLASPGGSP